MADFCKQCSEELFGEDYADLAGLCSGDETAGVICEDCGLTLVDAEGRCVDIACQKHGKEPKA